MKKSILTIIITLSIVFTIQTKVVAQRTGVYINNVEISPYDVSILQQFISPLYQGAYYIDYQGNFGVVGYYPSFNLYQAIERKMANQQNNYNSNNSYLQQRSGSSNSAYKWSEGKASGWSNPKTGNSVISDGTPEGTGVFIDGHLIN